jgi:hypothetical protein
MSNIFYILVFAVILIVGNPIVQQQFAQLCKKSTVDSTTGFLLSLSGIFLLSIFLLINNESLKEPFLFKVSEFNPRCNGLYFGKPTTFQFDRIGCKYNEPVYQFNPDMIETNGKSIAPYCEYKENQPLGYIAHPGDKLYDNDPHIFTNFGDREFN